MVGRAVVCSVILNRWIDHSYSHTGQYHALTSSAKFDPQGLWLFNDIGFAVYGTLKATLAQLVADAETGMTHKELKDLLHVTGAKHLNGFGDVKYCGATIASNRLYLYVSQDHHKVTSNSSAG